MKQQCFGTSKAHQGCVHRFVTRRYVYSLPRCVQCLVCSMPPGCAPCAPGLWMAGWGHVVMRVRRSGGPGNAARARSTLARWCQCILLCVMMLCQCSTLVLQLCCGPCCVMAAQKCHCGPGRKPDVLAGDPLYWGLCTAAGGVSGKVCWCCCGVVKTHKEGYASRIMSCSTYQVSVCVALTNCLSPVRVSVWRPQYHAVSPAHTKITLTLAPVVVACFACTGRPCPGCLPCPCACACCV
jgi:hypothetical protein